MRKLILKCSLSAGDIVMLTAAVRDLHLHRPGEFVTDVRTSCPEIWENNPFISPLSETSPDVEVIECSYPLIDYSNERPYHCLHGFIEFLNQHLKLSIKPTAFRGDIHLSPLEKSWYSQIHEIVRKDLPFWIVAAGGKYDISIKWWDSRRYQEVIDHFRGKIQFVQVGQSGHHHPRLNGVIDLRGKTSLRELIRLVHHSQGVLCSVTALMHLAAAVEVRQPDLPNRPCVVIAGGREPAHWEAYPHHQFIHTAGALSCCLQGGCWKDRVAPLNDGDERDQADRLCSNVIRHLPRCLDMIRSDDVIRRIETYFEGEVVRYLNRPEKILARRGVNRTRSNPYDLQPLQLAEAGLACDRFLRQIPEGPEPEHAQGRGIVICAGGKKYFANAWVAIHRLRHLGCALPIEVWHLDGREMNPAMKRLITPLGVTCVNAGHLRKEFPVRLLGGWQLKPYALLHSSFREVLLLDADNFPVVNPEALFTTPQYRETGALFWPDRGREERADVIWKNCGLTRPDGPEFESGQVVVDKKRAWRALVLTVWFNENSDFYYRHLHGDKETFHLAFEKTATPYSLVPHPVHLLDGVICQHDFDGRRVFQHRTQAKWSLDVGNVRVTGFWFEEECLKDLARLRKKWRR